MKHLTITLFLLFTIIFSYGQKYTLSGHIKDSETGEELIGAAIFVERLNTGASTNVYGFYSLTLPKGEYTIRATYLGYDAYIKQIKLHENTNFDFRLSASSEKIEEVLVTGEKSDKNITDVEMSTTKLQMKVIEKIPALLGEVDLIKTIQLLPGVQNSGEGSTGFYVRGGGVDQNLVLLDEATVFNASHLGGLFSVFNSDAIKDVKLYKGGIPAEFGGRLSSVLDVRMNDGNQKQLSGSGGIGILSSRLTLEGPIIKDKTTFLVAGRRTYADIFFPLSNNYSVQNSIAYFYDLNLKINHTISDKDRIFVSGYFGKDVVAFGSDDVRFDYGNRTFTTRWNHLFSPKLFSNFSFIYSKYDYGIKTPPGVTQFEWTSYIENFSLKNHYTAYLLPDFTLKFGADATYHTFLPGKMENTSDEAVFNNLELPLSHAIESAVFAGAENKIGSRLKVQYGLRFSLFNNIGEGSMYEYNKTNPKEYTVADSLHFDKGEIFNTYYAFEPRFGINLTLNSSTSIKASYNRMAQYIHLASNTMSATPLDLWFPSSPNVKPQMADQIAAGLFKNFNDNAFETSVEVYYKWMNNMVDFRDHASLLGNPRVEGELRFGEGKAYGAEFLVKKPVGKFTGWISYTWSRTLRNIPDIYDGWYPASYDKPHDVSVVLSYQLYPRLNVSANWIYSSGAPRTMPAGRFEYGNLRLPLYTTRNGIRLPDYHRADLSVTFEGKNYDKPKKRFHSSWNLSVYNIYDRHNAYSVSFVEDKNNPEIYNAEKLYLFSILPSLTWNFNF